MEQSQIAAVLGPTNTGKTHYAIERMLGYRTGVIGLPLRLLAREVYDKIVALRGPSVVALVTGEERIIPERVQYWVCTVEAMPQNIGADFIAIDEIQLCADPERGHIFTDRLLYARGLRETLFLGADTMRGAIAHLMPKAQFMRRERLSQLTYAGSKKVSRMPARSAIVGFSVDNVYAMAELLRRQKGGAAVVLGALSPRTRNAQVELYQNGDVEYLVATDAIGMGLNLDVHHVAFSALSKFDGRRMRPLAPNELAQIAGRAGRGMANGSFGVTGEAAELDENIADAIVNHRFTPIKKLQWRNSDLKFASVETLIAALTMPPDDDIFIKSRESDDLIALRTLAENQILRARLGNAKDVKLLWDVCRIPDFRGIGPGDHANILATIFTYVHEKGEVPESWFARQVKQVDKTQGDIDTLSKRLAYVRTWTYMSQTTPWLNDKDHWREETRRVEDRLSDALHTALTTRFVDRRTSVLMRRLKQKEALLAEVNENGDVSVEGEFVGRLEGFRFNQDKNTSGTEADTVKTAALKALAPHFHLRADKFYNAPDTEIDFTDQGGLMWGNSAVGKLVVGSSALKPRVVAFVDDIAGPDVIQKVERRLQHFIDRKINAFFEPLLNLEKDDDLKGLARGFAFQLIEGFGILPRLAVAKDVKALDQDARATLRKHGIRFGQFTVFMPLLLKPAPTRLRLLLWSLWQKLESFPSSPPPGLVTIPADPHGASGSDAMAGYKAAGDRAIRIDMLERLADMIRAEDTRSGFEAKADMLSITGMTLEQFANLMQGLGYRAEKGEREKVKAVPPNEQQAEAEREGKDADVSAQDENATTPDVPNDVAVSDEMKPVEAAEDKSSVAEVPVDQATSAPEVGEGPEMEIYYTFTWSPQRKARPAGVQNQDKGAKSKSNKRKSGKFKQGKANQPRKPLQSRAPKSKEIDPDNPFAAALMGLKVQE